MLEPDKRLMIQIKELDHTPSEHECEAASNSYVMSLVAIIVGLPLPIVNLIATLIFFLGNRKSSFFVRWHCTQALFSQLVLVFINSIGFWWTVSIVLYHDPVTNAYFAYILTLLIINISEFIATIYTAIQTRKGRQVEWWVYGALCHQIVPKDA